ncbi:MAG TPA: hypothetical protein PLJ34_04860 [Hyphomicrobiales bacterium]|nr:hypothetical protein [Hyphomicrobiales bacterium]
MDWAALGKKIIGLGAPVVGGALGGPAGAAVGAAIGAALGVDGDPDAIDAAIDGSGEAAIEAINDVEPELPGIYAEFSRQIENVNKTMRAELVAHSALQRNWRPLWGVGALVIWFLTGLSVIAAIATALVGGDASVMTAVAAALSGLAWFYTAPLAVLGVVAWGRTAEKTATLSEGRGPSLVEAIAGRIAKGGGK